MLQAAEAQPVAHDDEDDDHAQAADQADASQHDESGSDSEASVADSGSEKSEGEPAHPLDLAAQAVDKLPVRQGLFLPADEAAPAAGPSHSGTESCTVLLRLQQLASWHLDNAESAEMRAISQASGRQPSQPCDGRHVHQGKSARPLAAVAPLCPCTQCMPHRL